MKKWIAPLIFLLMIIVPVGWGMISAYHDNHHPEKCSISSQDIINLRHMIYVVDSAKYMPRVRWIRSMSDSALVEMLSEGDRNK